MVNIRTPNTELTFPLSISITSASVQLTIVILQDSYLFESNHKVWVLCLVESVKFANSNPSFCGVVRNIGPFPQSAFVLPKRYRIAAKRPREAVVIKIYVTSE